LQPESSQNVELPGQQARGALAPAILIWVLIAGLEFLVIHQLRPPPAVAADAPADQFSSARALAHLKVIAQKAHPTGSAENARVRDYLVAQLKALGLDPLVQTTTAASTGVRWRAAAMAASVNNIVARLQGLSNSKAVMLTAHYDSVPTGPGASDDGSGTVTLLETVRALRAGPPLKNDVLLVITDGEELGLLGAKAFVDAYPHLQDVGVVMNFEARGACGPAVMFETSEHNGWLVRQFAKAAPHPVSSSFTYEAYKRLPNDTDLTVFKRAGLAGLNFAYTGCWARYHTRQDSVQNLDERSLQHQGSYALALARRFGDLDLGHTTSENAVYLSVLGITILYSQTWVIPLIIAAVLLFAGVVALGLKKLQLTVRGVIVGAVGWLAGALLSLALSQALWALLRGSRFVSLLPYGMAYNGDLYAVGFVALTVAAVTTLYAVLRRSTSAADLTIGALAWWTILAVVTSLDAPGASVLFVWPALVSVAALGYAFTRQGCTAKESRFLYWALPAIVGILVFGAIPYLLIQLAGTTAIPLLTAATALLLGFLVPQLQIILLRTRWLLPAAAAAITLAFLAAAMISSGYDASHPRADSIFYLLDAGSGKAVWVSADATPDRWTSQFFAGHVVRTNLADFSISRAQSVLEAEAPSLQLTPPQVIPLDDVTVGDERSLRLLVLSPRRARVLWIVIQNAKVLKADVNGKRLPGAGRAPRGGNWRLVYVGAPKEGIVVTLTVPDSQPPLVKVIDQSDGLPEFPGVPFKPRPDDLMPWTQLDSSTLVSRTFQRFEMTHIMEH
jgi:hypothetical protein